MVQWETNSGMKCSIQEVVDFKQQKIYMDCKMVKSDDEIWNMKIPKDEFEQYMKIIKNYGFKW